MRELTGTALLRTALTWMREDYHFARLVALPMIDDEHTRNRRRKRLINRFRQLGYSLDYDPAEVERVAQRAWRSGSVEAVAVGPDSTGLVGLDQSLAPSGVKAKRGDLDEAWDAFNREMEAKKR